MPAVQEEMSSVLDAMFEKFCTDGEHIIDQDDDGDNFYVIERWVETVNKTTYFYNRKYCYAALVKVI